MKGLAKRMPVTFTCFTVTSLGLAGLPLMAGFVSKLNILEGAWMAGKPLFVVTLVAAALLALSYLMPVVQIAFGKGNAGQNCGHGHGDNHSDDGHGDDSHSHGKTGFDAAPAMLVPLVLTTVIAVILGILPNAGVHLYDLAQLAASAITEGGM